ncbi:cysteine synthase [Klebsormidium nitens]|uniref:cysteine synthase n=1 Tax=Klebsormidium nitens TaxID=105231 RepID=A0A1Y1IN28_KLENI|nr:cysteine synthase [Klebsormidium nitens]|eukprot:GAQ91512.1 cysteine synthase [Klebsormidium nitens]
MAKCWSSWSSRILRESVKDRIAKGMIEEAEQKGELIPGKSVIVEGTSGNTGIGFAAMACAKGYRLILVMPNSVSLERRFIIRSYGAELVLMDAAVGIKGILKKARDLANEIPHGWYCDQFDNHANQRTHYHTTGPEIWRDTAGKVDFFVAAVGTGGTITGAGRYLKEQNPAIKVVAVEPSASPVLSGGKPGPHKIQGMGAGILSQNMDQPLFDEIIQVADSDVFDMARALASKEALLSGISAGANVLAALQIARRPENKGKLIVTVIPSGGERYISTGLYDHLRDECTNMPLTPLE